MKFKEWIVDNSYFGNWIVEFLDVANMSTADIDLKRAETTEFDQDSAEEDCRDSVENYFDRGDFFDGIYDSAEEDPNFFDEYGVMNPDFWLDDNPEPDEEEEPEEHEKWKDEYQEVQDDYENAVKRWERDMRSKRQSAEESMSDAMQEAIDECIEEKRNEWEDENSDAPDVKYNFTIDSDNFEVVFNKGSEYVSGFNIPDIWDITFEGPRGYSTTNKHKNATAIYKQLLLSVKKLLETEEVKGLSFSPAEPAMALVYNQFIKQFLSKDFIRVQTFTLVKKDVVREILDGKWGGTEVSKNRFKSLILGTSREARQKLQQIKQNKLSNRKLLKEVPVGKITQMDTMSFDGKYGSTGKPAYIPVVILDAVLRNGMVFYTVGQLLKKREESYGYNAFVKGENEADQDASKFHIEITEINPTAISENGANVTPQQKQMLLKMLQSQYPRRYQTIANYLN